MSTVVKYVDAFYVVVTRRDIYLYLTCCGAMCKIEKRLSFSDLFVKVDIRRPIESRRG